MLTNCDYQLTAHPLCIVLTIHAHVLTLLALFSHNSLNEQLIAAKGDMNCETNVSSAKTTDKRNVRNVRNTLCCLLAIVLCVAIVLCMKFEFTGQVNFSSLLYLGLIYKMGKHLHLQKRMPAIFMILYPKTS